MKIDDTNNPFTRQINVRFLSFSTVNRVFIGLKKLPSESDESVDEFCSGENRFTLNGQGFK